MKPVRYTSAQLESIFRDVFNELGRTDADRLRSLIPQFADGEASLGNCAAELFGDAESKGGLKAFTSFRGRVNQAAKDADLTENPAQMLKFEADSAKRTDPHRRRCWFTGPDLAEESIERAVRDQTSAPSRLPAEKENPAVIVSSDSLGEPFIEWTAIFSKDSADRSLVADLLDRLETNLEIRQGIAYRRIREDPSRAQVIIPLISPAFCTDSNACRIIERGRQRHALIVPALLCHTGGRQTYPELQGLQVFRLLNAQGAPVAFAQCRADARKDDFASEFFQQIDRLVTMYLELSKSKHSPGPSPEIDDWPEEFARQQTEKGRLEAEAENPATQMGLERFEARNVDDLSPDGDAAMLLRNWALNPKGRPFFAVLGEYGIGKTTSLKRFARQLNEERVAAKMAMKGPKPKLLPPLAIYLDLRDFPSGGGEERVPTLERLLEKAIGQVWQSTDSGRHTAEDILKKVREDGAILIFDGLDERTVHMTTSEAQQFIRQLWRALPPSAFDEKLRDEDEKKNKVPGRLVISCRSHYFRTVREQRSLFLGERREGLQEEDYQALVVLPFRDEQIRDYLKQVAGGDDEKLDSMLSAIQSIHNLEELSHRPVLLDLIARQIHGLEKRKAAGETVRAVTLYDEMVEDWLLRDTGKHQFKSDHKREIMEQLAAAMWRTDAKEWEIEKAEEWLIDLLEKKLPHVKRRVDRDKIASELLEEDFRTATFIVRPGENRFRFAHTSFQEYFLARHLLRALDGDRASEAWDLPMPSLETLEFFGEIIACEDHPEIPGRLGNLLSESPPDARRNVFRYWLLAAERGLPEPVSAGPVDLSGCDLADWEIGRSEGLLDLRGASLSGADLLNTRFENVDLSGADLSGARCCKAEFHSVKLRDARAHKTDFSGAVFRGGDLRGIQGEGSRWGSAWVVNTEGTVTFPDQESENRPIVAPKTTRPQEHQWLRADGTVEAHRGHSDSVNACTFSPDGSQIVSGSSDKSLKLWDVESGRCLHTIEGHSDPVNACAFSPDGSRIVSGADDNTLKLWDAQSARSLQTLEGHSGWVNACVFSPDGSRIVSGSYDNTLKLWDVESGRCLQTLEGHSGWVNACAFSPDGSRIVSSSGDNSLKFWDAESGRCLETLESRSDSDDKYLKFWDEESGRRPKTLDDDSGPVFEGHSDPVLACGFSPDGSRIVSGSSDNSLKLWDADMLWDAEKVWDAVSGCYLQTLEGHSGSVFACGFSTDGSQIVSGSSDNSLKFWDARSGRCLQTLEGHSDSVRACGFSPDGARIVSGSADNTLKLWDVESGRCLQTLDGHAAPVRACAFSPDGNLVVSGATDRPLKIWDAKTGAFVRVLEGDSDWLNNLKDCSNGTKIVTNGGNCLEIRDNLSGRILHTLEGHSESVIAFSFSPDGTKIVSCSSDGSVRLWDAETGKELLQVWHGKNGEMAAIDSEGRLVSATEDAWRLVHWTVWDEKEKRLVALPLEYFGIDEVE